MGLLDTLFAPARPDAVVAEERADTICAPVSGRVVSLSKVSDPVFAQGMLGEGLAIVPRGEVAYAPASGVVTAVVSSKHAVAIKADSGAEVLLHVGVDTVGLKGRGFHTYVGKGDRVRAGEALIAFDAELIHGCGLDDTVIVTVTNPEECGRVVPACEGDVAAGEQLLSTRAAA
ncbi:MAG: PTS glucose transporter subunit IIA [Coriobacteriia bacterium]|nr:PTS glucose transporter subunit IIA [Coriobacteriia bacterium]